MPVTADRSDNFGFDVIPDHAVQIPPTTDEIARTVNALFPADGPLELRARKRSGGVGSGVYRDRDGFIRKARSLSWDADVEAVWVGLQTLRTDYPLKEFSWSSSAVKDSDIAAWRYIFVDVDTDAIGETATDEEKKRSFQDARKIKHILKSFGLEPMTADSGNGWHLLIPFRDLRSPETDKLVKDFVLALAQIAQPVMTNSSIDVSVANAGRVCKLYGSQTRKGTDDTRWRESKLRSTTDFVATAKALGKLIADSPAPYAFAAPSSKVDDSNFRATDAKLEEFLAAYGVRHRRRQPYLDGSKWVLENCPLGNHQDSGTKTIVTLTAIGFGFKCLAGKCADKGWHDLRAHLEQAGKRYSFMGPDKPMDRRPSPATLNQQSQNSASNRPRIEVVSLSQIEDQAIEWIWPGFIPRGKLTLLAGAPGTAKSTMTIDFAATVSNGGVWPDGTRCEGAGDVLLWSSEDDLNDTIKPRIVAAGANAERVLTPLYAHTDGQDKRPFDPSSDMPLIAEYLEQRRGIRLLIIDPIVSAIQGDMHRANDVRHALQPVVDLAQKYNVAVVGITHFAKNSGGRNTTDRVLGSQAFGAFARVVLVTAKDAETGDCVLVRSKSNITVDTGGHRYRLAVVNYQKGQKSIETTKIEWGERIDGSARNILLDFEDQVSPDETKVDQARNFLIREFAQEARLESKALISRAKEHGIGESSLRKAAEILNVQKQKTGFLGGWTWSIAPKMLIEDVGAPSS